MPTVENFGNGCPLNPFNCCQGLPTACAYTNANTLDLTNPITYTHSFTLVSSYTNANTLVNALDLELTDDYVYILAHDNLYPLALSLSFAFDLDLTLTLIQSIKVSTSIEELKDVESIDRYLNLYEIIITSLKSGAFVSKKTRQELMEGLLVLPKGLE